MRSIHETTKPFLSILSFFILFPSFVHSQSLQSLIAAENRFCQSALSIGIDEAFLKVLADTSVLLRPLPVNGKKHLSKQEKTSGTLSWRPTYAVVFGKGEWGFTMGPYEYRKYGEQSELIALGHYMSLWKMVKGEWKLVADGGITNNKGEILQVGIDSLPAKKFKNKKRSATDNLLAFDKAFSEKCLYGNPSTCYTKAIHKQARLLMSGAAPLNNKEEIEAYFKSKDDVKAQFTPAFAQTGADGSWGFVYGKLTENNNGKDKGLLRIWKRKSNKKWKLVAQLVTG